jgi:FtsP/CotA-like multicopper oxidase with cupredoxin domain
MGRRALVGVLALLAFAPPAAASIPTPPCQACRGFVTGQPLVEPRQIVSSNGVLSTTLTARLSMTTVGGRRVLSQVYDGQLPGPTLVVDPGDTMRVLLRNRMKADYLPYGASSQDPPPIFPGQPYAGFPQMLGNVTNLHVHGMHVSPNPPSDDVLLRVHPGEQYQYRYEIPADHPPGIYWYHPHGHHYTDMQVGQGQAGAIIVRGGLDDLPGIEGLRDRVMVIQNVEVKDGAVTSPQYQPPKYRLITINGQVQPLIDIKPGETQRWRLVNASNERFLEILPLGNAASFWQVAADGVALAAPVRIGKIWLSPGQRMEVLVRAGQRTGSFPLVQARFNQRPTPYGQQPRVQIATMRIAGATQAPQPIPTTLLPVRDVRGPDVPIAARRVIRFTQSPPKFFIDGAMFHDHHGMDPGPVFVARVNTVQEWTLANDSPEWHNFHIHVDDFQVVRRFGVPVSGQPQWFDTIAIPPHRTIVVRIPFDDFTGTFVFHCHVLVHEDHGMMAVVRVVD